MAIRAILSLFGLFHLVNGLWMLLAPDSWFVTIPGVTATGPLNYHFVADIGLAFIASGAGFLAGARNGPAAGAFAIAGATWPALHALFHLSLWLRHGFPGTPALMASEYIGVFGLGALGLWAAIVHARKQGTLT